MSELQRVEELLEAFGLEGKGVDYEKVLAVGLLLGYNAASALASTYGTQFSGSRTDWVKANFKERMEKRIKFTPPVLSGPLTANHLEQILEFHKFNLDLLSAL